MSLEPKHSKVGASKCEQWWNCPGSIRLSEGAPIQTPKFAAAEGTVAHAICEKALKGKWTKKLIRDEIGKVYEQEGFKIPVTEDMVDAVILYTSTIWEDHRRAMGSPHGVPEHYNFLHVEQKFHLTSIDKEAFGTNDANVSVPFGKLTVYDFKYGYNEVSVEENKQMLYYTLAAYLEDPNYSEAEAVIIQPKSEVKVKRWPISIERLEQFGRDLKERIAATRKEKAPLNLGDWCKYCPAVTYCPEQKKVLDEALHQDFGAVDGPILITETRFTPERIAGSLARAIHVKNFITEIEALAFDMAKSGVTIPGFKLVDSYGNRRWRDPKAVETEYKGEFGAKIYEEPKLKSPAQLEKLLGPKRKEETVELTERPYNGPTLVPVDDKRPEAKAAVEADFATDDIFS